MFPVSSSARSANPKLEATFGQASNAPAVVGLFQESAWRDPKLMK